MPGITAAKNLVLPRRAKPLAKRTRKSTQVSKPELAYLRWVAKRIRTSARKSQRGVTFTLIQFTCNTLRRHAYKFQLDQSHGKSSQVNASGWSKETQIERKSKTCVDLRRLVSPLGQGFSSPGAPNKVLRILF